MRNVKFLLLPAMLLLAGSAMAAGITSMTPNTGNNSGGNQVIIRGSGFAGADTVLFGAVSVAITAANITKGGTRITLNAPASPGVTGNVTVDVKAAGASLLAGNTGTYTFSNNELQINAKATIASIISLKWGGSTDKDSAGANQAGLTTAYSWVIGSTSSADAANATLSVNTNYKMSDDYKVTIENASSTGNKVDMFVNCSNALNGAATDWTLAGTNAAIDTFAMSATLTPNGGAASAALQLTSANQEIKSVGNADVPIPTGAGNEAQFDLNFLSPSSIDKGADTQETITVTITGLKD